MENFILDFFRKKEVLHISTPQPSDYEEKSQLREWYLYGNLLHTFSRNDGTFYIRKKEDRSLRRRGEKGVTLSICDDSGVRHGYIFGIINYDASHNIVLQADILRNTQRGRLLFYRHHIVADALGSLVANSVISKIYSQATIKQSDGGNGLYTYLATDEFWQQYVTATPEKIDNNQERYVVYKR